MENIQLLISDYLEGELTADELGRLSGLLETDSEALDHFVFSGFIHSQLLDWMDQQPIEAGQYDAEFDASPAVFAMNAPPSRNGVNAPSDRAPFTENRDHAGTSRRTRLAWTIAAIAATLLITATISILTRPVFVGQLTDVTNCRWGAEQAAMSLGTPFYNGQELNLIQGSAVITFASGAKMRLEGATSVRLDSPMEVRLDEGRIAVKVPRQATGFAVNSSLARFVDLGTAFTLKMERDNAFDLYVFEGMVEMQVDERFGAKVHQPWRVGEVQARHFDTTKGDVEPLPFNQGEQMPF